MSDQRRKRNESEEQRPSNALMFLPTSNFLNFFSTPITKSPRMLNDKKEDYENSSDENVSPSNVQSPVDESVESFSPDTNACFKPPKRDYLPLKLDLSEPSDKKLKFSTPNIPNRLSKYQAALLNVESKKEQIKGSNDNNQAKHPFEFDKNFLDGQHISTSPFIKPKLTRTTSSKKNDSGYFTTTKKKTGKKLNNEKNHCRVLFSSENMNTSNSISINNSFEDSGDFAPFSPSKHVLSRSKRFFTQKPLKTTTKRNSDSCDSDSAEVLQKPSFHFTEVSIEEAQEILLSLNRRTPTTAGKPQSLSVTVESIRKFLSRDKVCPQVLRLRPKRGQKLGKAVQVSRYEEKNGKILQDNSPDDIQSYVAHPYFRSIKLGAIGNGHFATTFEAWSGDFGRHAVKRMINRKSELRLKKDVHNHEALGRHPNVAEFYRAFIEDNALFVQMELGLTSCKSLEPYFHACNENCNSQWVLLIDCCKGLLHMHSRKIAHMDLKPDNIVLGRDWNFKLCDFGCSAKSSDEFIKNEHVHGGYQPPYLLSSKTDVYSLGECVWRLSCWEAYSKDDDLMKVVGMMKDFRYKKRPNASDVIKNDVVRRKNVEQFRRDMRVTLEPAFEKSVDQDSSDMNKLQAVKQ